MTAKIYFNFTDLLTLNETLTFLQSDPITKVELLTKYLKEIFLIYKNKLYRWYDNEYKHIEYDMEKYLITMTRKFVIQSLNQPEVNSNKKIQLQNLKEVYQLKYYEEFIFDLILSLTNDEFCHQKEEEEVEEVEEYEEYEEEKEEEEEEDEDVDEDDIDYMELDEEDEEDEEEEAEVQVKFTRQFTKKEIKRIIDLI